MARAPVPNGFSLLEVMVALAVFAVAALALVRLEAASLRSSATLDRRLLRDVTAGNLATQWRTDPGVAATGVVGGVVVNAGRRLDWQRRVWREDALFVAQITVRVRDVPDEVTVARVVRRAP